MLASLIQMSTVADKAENIRRAEGYISSASAQGAKIICLQELFNSIYFPFEIDKKHFELAETIPGPTVERMQRIAQQEGVVLVAPIFERVLEGLFFNSAAVIDVDGRLIGVYRKTSIPLIKSETMTGFEKYYFAPGDTGFRTFETLLGVTVGVLICYDRHFPEAARCLALEGAQVILVPTATSGMSRAAWEIELQGHAIANLCYVGGVNRVGADIGGGSAQWYGASLWAGPDGGIVAQAGSDADEVLLADLDLAGVHGLREDWGFFRDRRPEMYGPLSERRPAAIGE